MLVLSFRDMSTARCSAVTAGAAYWLQPIDSAFSWSPAPSAQLKLATWQDVSQLVRGKHVCFLVHGFNVDRDSGYTSLGCLGQELAGGGALVAGLGGPLDLHAAGVDVVIPVLWAGDWYLPINYPFLLPDIRTTAQHFAEFIWSAATQMSRVSFITHSMGARVVFETVQRAISGGANLKLPVFDMAIFTAPAVSDDIMDDLSYAQAVGAFRQMVVVSSTADTILSGDFPLGNAVEQALWTDDHGSDVALGRYGPKLKPGSKALAKTSWYPIAASVAQNHGDYVPAPLSPTADYCNGWSAKRERVASLAQALLDRTPPPWPASPITPVAPDA